MMHGPINIRYNRSSISESYRKRSTDCVARYSFVTLQQAGHAVMTEFYVTKAHNTGEAVSN